MEPAAELKKRPGQEVLRKKQEAIGTGSLRHQFSNTAAAPSNRPAGLRSSRSQPEIPILRGLCRRQVSS